MQQGNRSQFKGLLDSPFYHHIMSLNFQPLDWVHQDWLNQLPNISQAKNLGGAKAQLWLRQQLSLEQLQDSQFNDPIKRLIFLSNQELERLLSVIGLSCFQRQLALLIEKEVKQQIITKVGEPAVKLLQLKLPLLIAKYPESLLATQPIYDGKSKQLTAFFPYGLRLLDLATEGRQTSWYQLLRYKLPVYDGSVLSNINLSQAELARIRLLIQKIALEIEPKCTTLLK